MPLDSRKEKILQEAYYRDGLTFGRDALFDFLQKKYKKTHPTKEEVGEWLSRQKLQQLYLPTKKGGVTNSFQPTKPWASISIDLIIWLYQQAEQKLLVHLCAHRQLFEVYAHRAAHVEEGGDRGERLCEDARQNQEPVWRPEDLDVHLR